MAILRRLLTHVNMWIAMVCGFYPAFAAVCNTSFMAVILVCAVVCEASCLFLSFPTCHFHHMLIRSCCHTLWCRKPQNIARQRESERERKNVRFLRWDGSLWRERTKTTWLATDVMVLLAVAYISGLFRICLMTLTCKQSYSHSCCACKHLIWNVVLIRIWTLICCARKQGHWFLCNFKWLLLLKIRNFTIMCTKQLITTLGQKFADWWIVINALGVAALTLNGFHKLHASFNPVFSNTSWFYRKVYLQPLISLSVSEPLVIRSVCGSCFQISSISSEVGRSS